jgi:branched-chain amino acid transport system permease protein
VLGGVAYTFADHRLSAAGAHLPGPLAEPLFILGVLFILAVYFAPGGLSRLTALRGAIRGGRRSPASAPLAGEPERSHSAP